MFFRFPLRVTRPIDGLMADFAERRVIARRGIDTLLHRIAGLDAAAFPGAEACFETTLSIPIYPALSDDEASLVVDATRAILGRF
jgi:UDP-4-amino-4-deoxy-L-arabinose-oxoglutarate aminotransferase